MLIVFSLIFIYSYISLYFSFLFFLIFEDSFVNHLSVKLISSIKTIIITLLLGLCTTVSSTKQLLQLSYMYMRIERASHWNGVRIQGVSVISKPTL